MRFIFIHRDDLRKWQLATLEIQQNVQKIFETNEISGWCGGGTLIGAVRNGGFLYWDNDLDMFFRFQDYKSIIMSFRENNLLQNYDLVYFRNGYWQKNNELMEVLKEDKLDTDLLNFDLVELSKGMFKVFSRKSIPIRLYSHDFNKPEEYVQLQHFAPIHYTRKRLAASDIEIECGSEYHVLPELCMLPMLEITHRAYIGFIYRYAAKSILAAAANVIDYPEEVLEKANAYPDMGKKLPSAKFDKGILNPVHARASLLFRNLIKGTKRFIEFRKNRKICENSGKLIVYRPIFFRFFVMPFLYEDIFPLKKIKFENTTINVPNNPDGVLTAQFGNYMMEPEIKKRIAYPFFFEGQI